MAEAKQTEPTPKEESQASCCGFPAGDFGEMIRMMQDSCGEGFPDCRAMMRKMSGCMTKKADE